MSSTANAVSSDRFTSVADDLLAAFRQQRPIRSGSLLITVFGDAITVHGGSVWLGSLIAALARFGVSQRLVRTSAYRLAQDGWLQSTPIGRRSFYSLTESGRVRFDDASHRIYTEPRRQWDGRWTLAVLNGIDAAEREEYRRELGWLGFAPFSANLLAHPASTSDAVVAAVGRLPHNDKLLVLYGEAPESGSARLRDVVGDAWQLADLDQRYSEFLELFRPLYQAARKSRTHPPSASFEMRTLLIHEYRKILLRDPFLPDDLLPKRWNGAAAYQLCRNLYGLLSSAAEEFLTTQMESEDGPLPPAEPAFYDRFGGLSGATNHKAIR